jgi:hypothetical protein
MSAVSVDERDIGTDVAISGKMTALNCAGIGNFYENLVNVEEEAGLGLHPLPHLHHPVLKRKSKV